MRRRQLLALTATAAVTPGLSLAQTGGDFPSKPLKIVVPFPAGGTSDVMARMISEELPKILKQPVVVENIGGGGGTIGTERALRLPPDGYTIIQSGVGQNAVAHGLDPKLKYDSIADFQHLCQVHSGPNVLVVNPAVPFQSLKELVATAKARPGKLDYGFVHAASGHMAMELFKQTAGIYMVGSPYKGGGPMITDLLAGTIPFIFINQDVALPHIRAGKLRPLAVTTAQRIPLLPDVPTVAESGFPGFEALSWSGLSVHRATPKPIADKLEAAMVQAMQGDTIKTRLTSQGFVVPPLGAQPYTAFVKSELDRWRKVIKTAGITAQ
jgi:tripartite-type tricarboxylate transporter receptor subunit TctC